LCSTTAGTSKNSSRRQTSNPWGGTSRASPFTALGLPPQEEQALNELLLNVDRAESMRYLTIHLPTVYGARTFDARFAPPWVTVMCL
jgi:hypothetical protein